MINKNLNILGGKLKVCCSDPVTGFYRDGFCRTELEDHGEHIVCAIMTDAYLDFMETHGNYLREPNKDYEFPGLSEGDVWCITVERWLEAHEAGIAPQIIFEATHENLLNYVDREDLEKYKHSN